MGNISDIQVEENTEIKYTIKIKDYNFIISIQDLVIKYYRDDKQVLFEDLISEEKDFIFLLNKEKKI